MSKQIEKAAEYCWPGASVKENDLLMMKYFPTTCRLRSYWVSYKNGAVWASSNIINIMRKSGISYKDIVSPLFGKSVIAQIRKNNRKNNADI